MVFSTLSSIQCDFDILKSVSAIAFAQGVQEFVFILRPVSHEASHAMPLPPDVDALSDDEGPQPGIHLSLPTLTSFLMMRLFKGQWIHQTLTL